MNYFAVVRLTADQDFSVELPDFPEIEQTCESIAEAQRTAERALRDAVGAAARRGDGPPEPTPKQELECRPEYRSSFVFRVELDEEIARRARKLDGAAGEELASGG